LTDGNNLKKTMGPPNPGPLCPFKIIFTSLKNHFY